MTFVRGRACNFVASASRIACESSSDSPSRDHAFDIFEDKVVVCHLFKEVWNCKLVFTFSQLLSDDIDNSQSEGLLKSDLFIVESDCCKP